MQASHNDFQRQTVATPPYDSVWPEPFNPEAEGQTEHTLDTWMLTYLDVFVQLTAIFVVLFLVTQQPEPQPEPLPEAQPVPVISVAVKPPAEMTLDAEPQPELTAETEWQKSVREDLSQLRIQEKLEITLTGSMARINITDDLLFGSADNHLQTSGKRLLQSLVPMIMRADGNVMIEGHTDNRPIRNQQYASNWELGAARASEVLHFLAGEGVSEYRLRAVSYGATEPIAPNNSRENRQKNRRVSIVLRKE